MSQLVAEHLLDKACVELSPSAPFQYASGLKGPIYSDNRKLLSYVSSRDAVVNEFIQLIENEDYDAIVGLATGGIAPAAIIADRLKKPMLYVRSKAKGHGKSNQIEGDYSGVKQVVLVEDLVNQGSSLEKAIIALNEAGLTIKKIYCIVSYGTRRSLEILKKYNLNLISLTNLDEIISLAVQKELINPSEQKLIEKWREDPENWS